jgi:hypothetical protein
MSTKVTHLKIIHGATLPDGEYPATWGGYVISFAHDGKTYEASATEGVRTPNAKCVLTIRNGEMSVRTV